MRKSFENLLKNYKKRSFQLYHEHKEVKDELLQEAREYAEELLSQKYHYNFHKEPDKERAEIFNMIYNFTTEALLPPVVEKLAERIIILEKRHEMLLNMVTESLEVLSEQKKVEEMDS
jgi:hypothetical protein